MHVRIAREHGLPVPIGVGVVQVASGSPAAAAGIQPRDVIIRLDETPMTSVDDVHRYLSRAAIGATVRVGLLRRNQRLDLTATLEPLPDEAR